MLVDLTSFKGVEELVATFIGVVLLNAWDCFVEYKVDLVLFMQIICWETFVIIAVCRVTLSGSVV